MENIFTAIKYSGLEGQQQIPRFASSLCRRLFGLGSLACVRTMWRFIYGSIKRSRGTQKEERKKETREKAAEKGKESTINIKLELMHGDKGAHEPRINLYLELRLPCDNEEN